VKIRRPSSLSQESRLLSGRENIHSILYVTRWLDRQPHRNYVKTLSQRLAWQSQGFELVVAAQGREPYDAPLRAFERAGGRVLNATFANPKLRITGLVRVCLMEAIATELPRYQMIGIMDDDACFEDVPAAASLIKMGLYQNEFEQKYPDQDYGMVGPIGHYRYMASYKSTPSPTGFWPMNRRPWSLMGAQFYSRKVAQFFVDYAQDVFTRQLSLNDVFMVMLTHSMGLPVGEFYVPGWKHQCSRALKSGNQADAEWYHRCLMNTAVSHAEMTKFFSSSEDILSFGPFYVNELAAMKKYHLAFLNKKYRSAGHEPTVLTLEDLDEYLRRHTLLKETA
jgi:hypothetical protein